MKNLLVLLFISVLFVGCNNEGVTPNLSNLEGQEDLIGIWEYDAYEQINDTSYAQIYRKVNKIASDQAGITFKQTGAFISKQNAGWCGTPPISYADYEGNFQVEDKNSIKINSTYWGGKMSYKVEVLELSNRKLKIRPYDYEYEERN